MGNFLHELGLGFFMENQDAAHGLIAHTCQNGKIVTGYYGLPYINQHYGEIQICARIGNGEGDTKEFKGFDAHCDSLQVWPLRIIDKLPLRDKDDLTEVRLLTKSPAGQNMLCVDVLNGDILPGFKKDEIVGLQMIAFTNEAEFYADEEDYSNRAGTEVDGKKWMIETNILFPVGLFSDDDDIRDVVQIVAEIKKMRFGHCKFGEEESTPNYRFYVDTPLGELVIVLPAEYLVNLENKENIAVGRIISCFARLSGDAAVREHEDGLVKDAEHNLKLVAYSLESGDPERMRSVLAKNFTYHSDSSGKDISDIDEFIEFAKYVRSKAKPATTAYATITEISEGEGELKYPVGTRCAVIRYEGDEGWDAIIFVDTDDKGNIGRILLTREPRYRFSVDEPPADENEELVDAIASQTWQEAIVIRAHFHDLLDKEQDLACVENAVYENEFVIRAALSELFNAEISEDAFAKAYMRGVEKSGAEAYDADRLFRYGKQFHKDFTFRLSDEDQEDQFEEALILTCAVGLMYNCD